MIESSPTPAPTPRAGVALLELQAVTKHYPITSGVLRRQVGTVRAVDGVDLTLHAGETVALVGESGCGKTTLARTIVRLYRPTSGQMRFGGTDVTRAQGRALRGYRRRVQMVFQDPYASLNPRLTARQLVAEPLRIHHQAARDRRARADDLLERVGLDPAGADRLAGQFSGGQRQRIAIARALALRPEVLVLDEPVAALDVSVQAQILNLLRDLQRDLGVAYLFISHDLAVVRQVADRIAVMYLGRIVESASADLLYAAPAHPYTVALLSAVPVADPRERAGSGERGRRIVLRGDVPNPASPPSGCHFRTRCWKAQERCAREVPRLVEGVTHPAACHFPEPAP
ncbi:MAG: oligopeptide/dipeptide ABC transporter ATP-binding protein [Candidatus Dormiibacterota bacterium]